jgi:hypothetical protein
MNIQKTRPTQISSIKLKEKRRNQGQQISKTTKEEIILTAHGETIIITIGSTIITDLTTIIQTSTDLDPTMRTQDLLLTHNPPIITITITIIIQTTKIYATD